jgi:hypothetical protein
MTAGAPAMATLIARDHFGNACSLGTASLRISFERMAAHLQYAWSPHIAHASAAELGEGPVHGSNHAMPRAAAGGGGERVSYPGCILSAGDRISARSVGGGEGGADRADETASGGCSGQECHLHPTAWPGVFRVALRPNDRAGRYVARALLLDQPLAAPLDCYVHPARLSLAHSTADGPGVTAVAAGARARFQITPLDAFGNQCGVGVGSAQGSSAVAGGGSAVVWRVSIQARAAAHAESAAAAQAALRMEKRSDGTVVVQTCYMRSGVYLVHISGIAPLASPADEAAAAAPAAGGADQRERAHPRKAVALVRGGRGCSAGGEGVLVPVAGSPYELLVTPSSEDATALSPAGEWDGECVAGEPVELAFVPAPLDSPFASARARHLGRGGAAVGRMAAALMRAYVATLEAWVDRPRLGGEWGGSGGDDGAANAADGRVGIVAGRVVARGHAGGDEGMAQLAPPTSSRVPVPVLLCADGRVRLRFIGRMAADGYQLHLTASGRPIHGSPFVFRVWPGAPHGRFCRFEAGGAHAAEIGWGATGGGACAGSGHGGGGSLGGGEGDDPLLPAVGALPSPSVVVAPSRIAAARFFTRSAGASVFKVGETHTVRLWPFDACGNATSAAAHPMRAVLLWAGESEARATETTSGEGGVMCENASVSLCGGAGASAGGAPSWEGECEVRATSAGGYTVRFRREKAGRYVLRACFGGSARKAEMLPPAELPLELCPAALSVPHCTARGAGVARAVAAAKVTFWLELRDRFGNLIGQPPAGFETSPANSLLRRLIGAQQSAGGPQVVDAAAGRGAWAGGICAASTTVGGARWSVSIRSRSREQAGAAAEAERSLLLSVQPDVSAVACTTTFARPGLYTVAISGVAPPHVADADAGPRPGGIDRGGAGGGAAVVAPMAGDAIVSDAGLTCLQVAGGEGQGQPQEIRGSPFQVIVESGSADPRTCTLLRAGVSPPEAGENFSCFLVVRDAQNDPVTAASVLEAVSARLVRLGHRTELVPPSRANIGCGTLGDSGGGGSSIGGGGGDGDGSMGGVDGASSSAAWATAFACTSGEQELHIGMSADGSVLAQAAARAHRVSPPLIEVRVLARHAGCYELELCINGEHVRGSPEAFEVLAGPAHPTACAVAGWPGAVMSPPNAGHGAGARRSRACSLLATASVAESSGASGAQEAEARWWSHEASRQEARPLVAGEVRLLRLIPYDALGNRRTRGGDLVRMLLRTGTCLVSAPVRWDAAGGCYEMELCSTVAGPLEVLVGVNGVYVFGSDAPPQIQVLPAPPVHARILPGPMHRLPASGWAAAPLLVVGHAARFELALEDRFGNRVGGCAHRLRARTDACTAAGCGATGGPPVVTEESDHLYTVRFTPDTQGEHMLDVILQDGGSAAEAPPLGSCAFVVGVRPTAGSDGQPALWHAS